MSYIVNRTDGNIAAVVNDGVIDNTTSISLVGKGYLNYAETVAESLVALLENFSNTTAPPRPLPGQLWYDKGTLQLNIYNGTKFKPVNNVYVNTSAPTNPQTGDFWFNDTTKQLNFYKQGTWQIVAPAYSKAQERTELVVETWNDISGNPHTVLVLYVKGIRTVAVSSDEEFETGGTIEGFPIVATGITLANSEILIDAYFKGAAETAFMASGLDFAADATYMHANGDTSTVGTISVVNNGGIIIGANSDITISVPIVASPYTFGTSIAATSNKSLGIVGYGGGAIVLDNATNRIGINTNTPGYELDLAGTLNVSGYIRSADEYRFSDGSRITSVGDTIRLKPNNSSSVILNSDLTVEIVGDTTFDSGITVNNDSTFNANVSASTTPSDPDHLTNKYYVDQLALKNFLPIGSIIMWYGSPATVPNGWAICNGLNGTPDLSDKFIMGAGGAASLGQSGGENFPVANTNIAGSHYHTGTSDPSGEHNHSGNTGGHSLTAGEVAGHTHTYSDLYGLRDDANPGVYDRHGNRLEYYTGWGSDGDNDSGAGIFRDWQTDSTGNSDPHIHSISNANAHTHTITIGSNGAHYHTFTIDNRPAWYALYYIMKIANLLNEV